MAAHITDPSSCLRGGRRQSQSSLKMRTCLVVGKNIAIGIVTCLSLSMSFSSIKLFCFPELVLSRCVYAVKTLAAVLLQTFKGRDVSVNLATARRAPTN
ncbi:hypothetical protein TNCV_2599631 [Trichonephila clavipes]|nr:hypothetical protein TNCV_2599631 [Trichonephila clavipes]